MTSSINPSRRYSLVAAIPWQQMGNQVLILDSARSRAHELNPAASLLWRRLVQGEVATAALAECLSQRYGLDHPRALQDTQSFLQRMEEAGLVQCRQ